MPRKSVAEIEQDIDKALRNCRSPFAEGLWRRMRYLAETESDRKPHARINGLPVKCAEQLSLATGCSARWVARGLPKLLSVGLIVENPEGYFAPHLQQIMQWRQTNRARQERFRNNATKAKGRALRNAQEGVTFTQSNAHVTLGSPPSLSPPTTPSYPTPTPNTPSSPKGDGGAGLFADGSRSADDPEFWELAPLPLRVPDVRAAWAEWLQHRRERKPKVTETAARKQFAQMAEWGPKRAVAAIQHSIAGSYQGLFEPKQANGSNGAPGKIPFGGKYCPG